MKEIKKIQKIPLRTVWEKEDKNFTVWLSKNIDFLNEVLDIDISVEGTEANVGPFRVDIYGEDSEGFKVIIENQLEKTDHSHLGQLLTYMVNLEANRAIWIVGRAVDEHISVIEWLNEVTPDDKMFYLVQVEAIQLQGCDAVSPLFTVVEGPSVERKQIGTEKKKNVQRQTLRKEFWGQLLEKAAKKTKLHQNITPSMYSWVGTGAGRAGVSYNYSVNNTRGTCEVYLDRGQGFEDPNVNKLRFDALVKNKKKIESVFGDELIWERLDNRRASRVAYQIPIGLKDEDSWDELQEKLIDSMIKLDEAMSPYINKFDKI